MVVIAKGIVFSVNCKIILNFKCALLKWGFIRNSSQWLAYLYYKADRTAGGCGGLGAMVSPLFCVAKTKETKGKKISKQKLLKDCHQCQNVTVLTILERLEFKKFYCR